MDDGSKLIPLTQGTFAVVDAADYEWLSQWEWSMMVNKAGNRYARRKDGTDAILMHREIMHPGPGYEVDHWDNDGLNNQRSNLRVCTRSQNNFNKQKSASKLGRMKGVAIRSCDGLWGACIRTYGNAEYLGGWFTETEAAEAYDDAARILHLEFAAINFPMRQQVWFTLDAIRREAQRRNQLRHGTAPYMGVSKSSGRFYAYVHHNGHRVWLKGGHATPEQAAKARDIKAKELYGNEVVLNFPEEV